MAFEVTRVQLGEMGTNGYILYDNVSGDCAFIDVGDYGERLRVFLKNKGIDICLIACFIATFINFFCLACLLFIDLCSNLFMIISSTIFLSFILIM